MKKISEAPSVTPLQEKMQAQLLEQSRQRLGAWRKALESLPSVTLFDECDPDKLFEGFFEAGMDENHTIGFAFYYDDKAELLMSVCSCGHKPCPAKSAKLAVESGIWLEIFEEMQRFLQRKHSQVPEAPTLK